MKANEMMKKLIGDFLRRHRKALGLSQSYIARRLHYGSPQFVSNWERGESIPPPSVWPQIKRIYNFDEFQFVDLVLFEQRKVFLDLFKETR